MNSKVVVAILVAAVALVLVGGCAAVVGMVGGSYSPGIEIDIDNKKKSCPAGKKYNTFTKKCESKSTRLGRR